MKSLKDVLFGRTWAGSVGRIVALLVFCSIPFGYHYQTVWVDGISMEPTYDDGQWILMQRKRSLGKHWVPDRFDVIIVRAESLGENLCKRVIGLPGETVDVIEGQIFINGKQLSDSFGEGYMVYRNFIDPETQQSWFKEYENIESEVIKKGQVWVIGDNRQDSFFGHFPIKEIHGKVILY
tara:strand:- start:69 stop:608 length:540 start_codon:yes stop_codon:yes gene_type:complete